MQLLCQNIMDKLVTCSVEGDIEGDIYQKKRDIFFSDFSLK